MTKADIIVVNHALLLADLELGGGIILPPTDECFFIIDEAHHLPKIARDFSSAETSLQSSLDWLKKVQVVKRHIDKTIKLSSAITPGLNMMESAIELSKHIKEIQTFFDNNSAYLGDKNRHRFENGEFPQALNGALSNLKDETKKCLGAFNKLAGIIEQEIKDANIKPSSADKLLIEIGIYQQRLESMKSLWQMLTSERSAKETPIAAWVEQENEDTSIKASPIEVGGLLEKMFWSEAAGVILCSATLTSLNSFDYFIFQAGLQKQDGTQYLRLKSPFDYPAVSLIVDEMKNEPTQDGFDNELVDKIEKYIEEKTGNLVLFASYWQMNLVADKLGKKYADALLVQGDLSRSKLIATHKKRCDNGQTSILFGTGSLSEGLDLPGNYLTNLIITKIPFAVPNSPVEEAHSEWISSQGGNPFMQLSIPEASKKLTQATGRLIRKENDTGQIVLLDKRVKTKRYGKSLLDALPPFTIKY
jgi:ATP-dependent DNA helicase DinG